MHSLNLTSPDERLHSVATEVIEVHNYPGVFKYKVADEGADDDLWKLHEPILTRGDDQRMCGEH